MVRAIVKKFFIVFTKIFQKHSLQKLPLFGELKPFMVTIVFVIMIKVFKLYIIMASELDSFFFRNQVFLSWNLLELNGSLLLKQFIILH